MGISLLPPALIFKVKDLKGSVIGRARGFIVLLESDSESTYRHELEHVKQFWIMALAVFFAVQPLAELTLLQDEWVLYSGLIAGAWSHGLLYRFVRPYRQWAEVQAFKKSIKYGRGFDSAAMALSSKYNLDITHKEAEKLLRG